jgi:hypothetical protein
MHIYFEYKLLYKMRINYENSTRYVEESTLKLIKKTQRKMSPKITKVKN